MDDKEAQLTRDGPRGTGRLTKRLLARACLVGFLLIAVLFTAVQTVSDPQTRGFIAAGGFLLVMIPLAILTGVVAHRDGKQRRARADTHGE